MTTHAFHLPTPLSRGLLALLPLALLLLLTGCGSEAPAEAAVADAGHEGHNHAARPAADEQQLWTCGMHPHVVQDAPGQCPICGMDLVPLQNTGASGIVEIDPVTIQNIGVRTAVVDVAPLERMVRTTGRFEASERARTAVSPKIGGWVEQLHVNYEGARVRRGQPLLELYSPALVSTQEEYLLALRNARRQAGTPAAQDAQRLLEAARRRLAYWDISEAQVRRLEETEQPQKTLTLYAPAAGTVTLKNVVEGQQVTAGETLLELSDLGHLWLMVDVYEQDLAWVEPGTQATIELPYEPGRTLQGRVDYLYDTLDPAARTVQARVTVANPGLQLKPGMYATVTLLGEATAPRPLVPAEALLRTGDRELVILALGEGRFRPHEVTAGVQSGDRVQILEGLQGGEEVVTSAQFLIDSEARLQSAVGAMAGGHDHGAAMPAMPERQQPAADHGPGMQQPASGHGVMPSGTAMPGDAARHDHGPAAPAEEAAIDVRAVDRNGDGYVYQCAMDWHVLHDAEGRCEVCGMNLSRFSVDEARRNLQAAGHAVRGL